MRDSVSIADEFRRLLKRYDLAYGDHYAWAAASRTSDATLSELATLPVRTQGGACGATLGYLIPSFQDGSWRRRSKSQATLKERQCRVNWPQSLRHAQPWPLSMNQDHAAWVFRNLRFSGS
jgi:hypothetical protein